MMAMTTSSSISVNAWRIFTGLMAVSHTGDEAVEWLCYDRGANSLERDKLLLYQGRDLATRLGEIDTIMAQRDPFENQLREQRSLRGWSQDALARRSGFSRAEVSAIETGRLVPSTAAALALAAALGCRVEDLFRLRGVQSAPQWAWPPRNEACRYWAAQVGGMVRLYPAEATALGTLPHDGVKGRGALSGREDDLARRTLVMASCDPAAGLLADGLAKAAGIRLLALPRPSREALALLGQGLVHVAGVHLSPANQPAGNARVVRDALGPGFCMLRAARWEEGIAFALNRGFKSPRAMVRSDICWIGREVGSGARQCLDELLGGRKCAPLRLASDHRGVAEAVKSGWADAGVCLRLVTEEAGLGFLGVREEAYDLCFPSDLEGDPRIRALLEAVRSRPYRKALGELPGYDSKETGELKQVN
jgi:molybdate-binding protein/transcriptional regulator with XRE-family HTH domain